jgi:hypothetical protein
VNNFIHLPATTLTKRIRRPDHARLSRHPLYGQAREVYTVTADSPEDARERWDQGNLFVSEASSMEVASVEEDK